MQRRRHAKLRAMAIEEEVENLMVAAILKKNCKIISHFASGTEAFRRKH